MLIRPNFVRLLCCLALVLFSVSTAGQQAFADAAADKGLEIARKVDKANAGFEGEESTMEMLLINAHGDETKRKMRSVILEGADDGDKSRIEFDWPADVKGTRMLTWTHKRGDDDQWLYLPAIKRVKRISARNKSGSFMGSEFSYEDLGSQEVEKFTYKFMADEKDAQGRPVWKIERVPVDPRSGYSKQVLWIDKGYMNPVRTEYYDRKGELLKTAVFSDYKKFGSVYRAAKIEMKNVQTRKVSVLSWRKRKLGVDVDTYLFESDELSE